MPSKTRPPRATPTNPEVLPAALHTLAQARPPEWAVPDAQSPRGKILAAARLLFAEHGFSGTSTRAVAEASGVNLAMIHYYFKSKEQLYEQVLAFEVMAVFRHALVEIPPDLPPEEALLSIPLRVLSLLISTPVWTMLLRREVADGGEYLQRAIRSLGDYGPLKARDLFLATYKDAVRRGKLRDLPPDAVRELLLSIGFSAAFTAPLLAVFNGRSLSDETVLNEWKKTLNTVLRKGLVVEKEGRK